LTQVVTISATTAAYAAEAAKPSTHMRGGGLVDEAITLLSAGRLERITMPSKIGSLLPLHLMLIGAERRLPQQTQAETLRRYLENGDGDDGREDRRQDDNSAGDETEQGEIAEMLDRIIQGS